MLEEQISIRQRGDAFGPATLRPTKTTRVLLGLRRPDASGVTIAEVYHDSLPEVTRT